MKLDDKVEVKVKVKVKVKVLTVTFNIFHVTSKALFVLEAIELFEYSNFMTSPNA